MNTGVVFMGAAWFSGSTLLGVMLGSHPSIFFAGEARHTSYFDDPDAPLKQRVCRLCGPGCTVWGDLQVTHGEDLYEMLSRRTRRPLVFDSSKRISWIKPQISALRDLVPLRLIVLTRDGRAVVNSQLRKWPETSAREHAAAWAKHMRGIEELASCWPGSVHRLCYEELTSRPEFTLRALTDFLGVAFDPVMLDPWNSDQHPLGSNDGPLLMLLRERSSSAVTRVITPDNKTRDWYGTHPRGIVLDLRWKHELSADELAGFEEVAGEINRAYAWEEPME
ncbi:MAG TPA: sulfotransferase [Pseudonocardiaceae bacterium]|nr:sulfotransferase [Pseudonocardiaceae bacterium]